MRNSTAAIAMPPMRTSPITVCAPQTDNRALTYTIRPSSFLALLRDQQH
jgi:hypothetical protein